MAADVRVWTMGAIRQLLTDPSVSLVEFGAGVGSRKAYLHPETTYQGLETRTYATRFPGPRGPVLVGDYLGKECYPTKHFDVAVAADLARFAGKEKVLLHRLSRAIKETGVVYLSWKGAQTVR